MRNDSRKDSRKDSPEQFEIERERGQFTRLLALNPNYFGNMPESGFPAASEPEGNTSYEGLSCLGYSADHGRIEATIDIKRSAGYAGDLCTDGSFEYVRFYVDYGAGWIDTGLAAARVHDVPAGTDCGGDYVHPLSYSVGVPYSPRRRRCSAPNLQRVRAILSWQVQPPPNQPNWLPYWGEVHECTIEIPPGWRLTDIFKPGVLSDIEFSIMESLAPKFALDDDDDESPVAKPMPMARLAASYRETKRAIEPHRLGYAQAMQVTQAKAIDPKLTAATISEFKEAGIDWADVIAAIEDDSGDTSYEELECLALDNNMGALTATFVVKRPYGYGGSPCDDGSNEYVAFWVDWFDTCKWTYAGTVATRVHDYDLPDGVLCYTAILPVDLDAVRRHCRETQPARLRAVLSWATPPSTTDPFQIPYWGNAVESHVVVRPGDPYDPTNPKLTELGGVLTIEIDSVTGLTVPGAALQANGVPCDAYGRPCPFAGLVTARGQLVPGTIYRLLAGPEGGTLAPVTATFRYTGPGGSLLLRTPGPGGWIDARATDTMLGWIHTYGETRWVIQLEIQGHPGNPVDVRVVQVDHTLPTLGLEITSGNCGQYQIGTVIQGVFSASDAYLSGWSLSTKPFSAPPGQLVPTGGTTSVAPNTGWTLDTANMQSCGYIIELVVSDRAIVNSHQLGRHVSMSRGFCLEE